MEKANVINALGYCAAGNCEGCYYYDIEDCDSKMCKDAIALLKANETTNAKPKYPVAVIFTKRDNLLDYLNTDKMSYGNTGNPPSDSMREYYAKERDIELILLCRYDNRKLMCRIKCPVNPIPVKGEFEAPNYGAICRFLTRNGWKFKEKFYPSMFT